MTSKAMDMVARIIIVAPSETAMLGTAPRDALCSNE
jgi:hypothetical protein